jgi:peptidoglycan LD-endopeptidase LytH
MTYRCLILPRLADATFAAVDLGAENFESPPAPGVPNPYRDVAAQEALLTRLRDKYRTQYTIGGYLEDRTALWNGFEKSSRMIHLGVDVNNLTAGEPVSVPCDATVVHVMRDTSSSNGWGGRVIFQLATPFGGAEYLLYGHLRHDLPDVGTAFKAGDIVAHIGDPTANGGWFGHLHAQLLTRTAFNRDIADPNRIDGYLLDHDAPLTAVDLSVDPMPLICRPVE